MASSVQTFTPRELLATGELIILPSDAAALRFRRIFDADRQASGLSAWQPPPVLSWTQWLQSLWSECVVSGVENRLLLNATQEHQLWRSVIAADQEAAADSLSSADSLAGLASAAWKLADAYGATRQIRAHASTHDTRTFAAWAEEFDRICQHEDYLSHASLEAALAEHIKSHLLAVPTKLCVAGFLNFTPQQNLLLDAISGVGSSLTIARVVSAPEESAERFLLRAEDQEQELQAVSIWIRQFLESRAEKKVGTQIGVVLPDMHTDRNSLELHFRQTLTPESQLIGADLSASPYEFSSGSSLDFHPMIAAALDLARLAAGPLPLSSVSALLLSPYLPSSDLKMAAQFDACVLRQVRFLRPENDLRTLLRLARSKESGAASLRWIEPLHQFLSQSDNLQLPRSFADWSEFIRRLLRAASWPGDPTSVAELQLGRAWDHVLDTVATLDFAGKRVPYAEALRIVEKLAASSPLTRSTQTAPIQVLGPSELPGMSFDALIYLHAIDTNLSATENPNPLIDWRLQASLGMPGADRSNTAARSNLELANLLTSAATVVFSYATSNAEGQLRLSPFVSRLQWPIRSADEMLSSIGTGDYVEAETIADERPLPPLPSSQVHGGASVLQHQAACGFRAFAEIRLRASELESQETGFDARESGELLHQVMSQFWAVVKTQKSLKNMPSSERQSILSHSIDEAFSRTRPDSHWDNAYIALQKQRLATLLTQWLEHELSRSPFTVLETEKCEEVAVGPLDLQVRIDRIDHVGDENDGNKNSFLIDYKTGLHARPQGWLGERPDEPQLPLYALLPEAGTLSGLAFAKIRAGESMGWEGYAAAEGMLPKRNTVKELEILLDEWRANLHLLAEAFAEGDAGVNPKDYPATCVRCAQRLLCRLDPATWLALSDEDENSQEEDFSIG